VLVAGAGLGSLVDRHPRLRMVTCAIFIQNAAVALTCGLVAFYFNISSVSDSTRMVVAVSTVLLSIVSYLASIAARISVEKDWIVCLFRHDSSTLARVNANIRTIDLTCNLAAPLLAGQLLYFWSYRSTAITLCIWVAVSATLELLLLRHLYSRNKKLQIKDLPVKLETTNSMCSGFQDTWNGWKSFMQHQVRDAGVGLALLYMTVLGFDNITWGFCLLQGVSESVLGLLTGVSACVGIIGARMFPSLCSRLGIERTGMLGFTLLSACMAISVSSVWSPGSPFSPGFFQQEKNHSHIPTFSHDQVNQVYTPGVARLQMETYDEQLALRNISSKGKDQVTNVTTITSYNYTSVTLLLCGIISGRLGLWVADLAVQQIFQEKIAEDERGVLCGVQTGLQSGMDLIKFLLVIALPHQYTFGFLIIASFLFISCGGLFFLKFCINQKEIEFRQPLLQK